MRRGLRTSSVLGASALLGIVVAAGCGRAPSWADRETLTAGGVIAPGPSSMVAAVGAARARVELFRPYAVAEHPVVILLPHVATLDACDTWRYETVAADIARHEALAVTLHAEDVPTSSRGELVRAVVETLRAQPSVSERRISLVGFGAGGTLAMDASLGKEIDVDRLAVWTESLPPASDTVCRLPLTFLGPSGPSTVSFLADASACADARFEAQSGDADLSDPKAFWTAWEHLREFVVRLDRDPPPANASLDGVYSLDRADYVEKIWTASAPIRIDGRSYAEGLIRSQPAGPDQQRAIDDTAQLETGFNAVYVEMHAMSKDVEITVTLAPDGTCLLASQSVDWGGTSFPRKVFWRDDGSQLSLALPSPDSDEPAMVAQCDGLYLDLPVLDPYPIGATLRKEGVADGK